MLALYSCYNPMQELGRPTVKPNWWLATEERRRGITRQQSPMRARPSPCPPADTAAGLCLLPGCSTRSLQRPACRIRHVCIVLPLPALISLILWDPNCLYPSVLLLPSPFILSLNFLLCCFPTLCLSPCLSRFCSELSSSFPSLGVLPPSAPPHFSPFGTALW